MIIFPKYWYEVDFEPSGQICICLADYISESRLNHIIWSSHTSGQGRLEPVAVEVKSDRMGLGWQQMITDHRKKLQQQKQRKQQRQRMETDPEKFR